MAVLVLIHVDHGGADVWRDPRRVESFEAVYRRWYGEVLRLCKRHLGGGEDAEAVAQEAFLRVWLARDSYSPVKPFWPWLSVIARRLCLDHRRRLARQRAAAVGVEAEVEVRSPDVWIEVNEELTIVLRAIDRLRPLQRRALLLRELEGWSYREIAEFQGVTVESVRATLKRARAMVRSTVVVQDNSPTSSCAVNVTHQQGGVEEGSTRGVG